MTRLHFADGINELVDSKGIVFIGSKASLLGYQALQILPSGVSQKLWREVVEHATPGLSGAKHPLSYMEDNELRRLDALVIPIRNKVSRHNHPAYPHVITTLLSCITWMSVRMSIVVLVEHEDDAFAAGCAVARAFPLYSRKTTGPEVVQHEAIVAMMHMEKGMDCLRETRRIIEITAEGIRTSQRLVDMAPNDLTVDAYVRECEAIGKESGATVEVLRMKELQERGMGCLEFVGRAATEHSGEPAMVILSRLVKPTIENRKKRTVCLVGKGIVFDTGGLSIKSREGMCDMKMDMGGSAACLMAFNCASKLNFVDDLHAVLCIAENGVGPTALKPDDIITSYSEKTIEINNPDAEGRLVLADGVSYAAKDLGADVIVDMATLTGAQMIATGQRHAAIITNNAEMETVLVAAGKCSGDLTWALPYCPEFFRSEFQSRVADMKNSVKNRANAQTSCAAQFIADHLPVDYTGIWAHIDMAGPAMKDGRATGYGVALLIQLLGLAG